MTTRLDLKTLKLVDNDLVFDDRKDLQLVEDFQEVEQAIERNLTQGLGGWFLNIVTGLDKFALVDKLTSNEEIFNAIRDCLAQEERVARLENFRINKELRELKINFDAVLINGEVVEVEL